MSRKLSATQASVLAVVLVCAVIGLFMLAAAVSLPDANVFSLRAGALLLAGAVSLFAALLDSGRPYRFFIGMNLCFAGSLLLFGDSGVFPLTSRNVWPLIVIIAGVSLVPMSIYSRKKLIAKYIVPALGLIALGAVYLVFALRLVKVSLIQFVRVWWPLWALLVVSVFVCMFFYQMKIRRKIWKNFPDIVDEPDDFSEEGDAE